MHDNPYAPPRADFELGRCFSEAWLALRANFPVWVGVGATGAIVSALAFATLLGVVLVIPVLAWGATFYLLRAHDGTAQFSDLFAGFSDYGRSLASMLGCAAILSFVGLLVPALQLYGELTENAALVAVGAAISVVAALTVIPRLALAYLYAVDRGCGARAAVSQAWRETAPLKRKIAILTLLSYALVLGGLLAFIAGVIPAILLVDLMWVSAYRQYGGPRTGQYGGPRTGQYGGPGTGQYGGSDTTRP